MTAAGRDPIEAALDAWGPQWREWGPAAQEVCEQEMRAAIAAYLRAEAERDPRAELEPSNPGRLLCQLAAEVERQETGL
jgi:hypothetical protein